MSGAEGKSDIDLLAVRSILFLPASNPRAIAKARASKADLVVLDLEDAVKGEDKVEARTAAIEAVDAQWPMPVAIRINGKGSEWFEADLAAVAKSAADLVVLPRADSTKVIGEVGKAMAKQVLAMIETAAGVLAAKDIALQCAALIAGTNDLRADLRLPLEASRQPISAALQWIVLSARAAGVAVFDGVFNDLRDAAGFAAECADGRSLGFDGKSLIHPDQIEPCNRLFGPTAEEIARARELADAFTGGAQRLGDQMIERMHFEAAERVLERARR